MKRVDESLPLFAKAFRGTAWRELTPRLPKSDIAGGREAVERIVACADIRLTSVSVARASTPPRLRPLLPEGRRSRFEVWFDPTERSFRVLNRDPSPRPFGGARAGFGG